MRIRVTFGLCDDEPPVAETLRDGLARSEIHHVHRADRADIGQTGADRRAEPIGVGGKDAADQHVGDFRRRQIDEPGQQPGIAEILHRPSADAGRMEDQAIEIAFQTLRNGLHGGRRHAEHGYADRGAREPPARFARLGGRQSPRSCRRARARRCREPAR